MAKKGYYAVANGRNTGVYETWADCQKAVNGFSNAKFKKFDTMESAQSFVSSRSGSGSESSYGNGGASHLSSNSGYSGSTGYYYGNSNTGHTSNNSYVPSYSSYGNNSYSGRNSYSSASRPKKSCDSKTKSGPAYYGVHSTNGSLDNKVFDNWNECQKYVSGQKGVSFKRFGSESEARNFSTGTAAPDIVYGHMNTTEEQFRSQHKVPKQHHSQVRVSTEPVNVYCDGSSLSNGRNGARAGYGVYFEKDDTRISRPLSYGPQTNSRAEISAVSHALSHIWQKSEASRADLDAGKPATIDKYTIHTDSEYVAKMLNDYANHTNPAELAKVANADLVVPMVQNYLKVQQFYKTNQDIVGDKGVRVEWIKAHVGIPGNEMADDLAKQGAMMTK